MPRPSHPAIPPPPPTLCATTPEAPKPAVLMLLPAGQPSPCRRSCGSAAAADCHVEICRNVGRPPVPVAAPSRFCLHRRRCSGRRCRGPVAEVVRVESRFTTTAPPVLPVPPVPPTEWVKVPTQATEQSVMLVQLVMCSVPRER